MEEEIVSRSQKKREVEALQELGAALVALPAAQLESCGLPAPLLKAVLEAQRIRSHEARRRQVQYIGKVMRSVDPAPVRALLAEVSGRSSAVRARQMQLEAWRERLVGDDGALTAFAAEYPHADLQAMRALIRNARKEIAEAKPPRAQRELYRLLRETSESKGDVDG